MKEKRTAANWYIAATHWLTTTILSTIVGFLVVFLLVLIINNAPIVALSFIIVYPLMMWFIVKYSANYISKRYVINDSKQIATLATIYLTIVGGGFRVRTILIEGGVSFEQMGFALAVIVFYFASKKFIKTNSGF